ncbi:MAG TPA: MFS transporter [Anaerolineae bacterium]
MAQLEKAGRRITAGLLLTQSFFSATFIMVFTISSIIVVELAGGNNQWLGVPSTVTLLGAAMIAYPIGRLMDKVGRRIGLSFGHIFGMVGALVAGWAVINESLIIFLIGILFIGLAKGVSDLGRYAAAEANVPAKRARALSLVVLGGTVGSITGPGLIQWSGALAARAGLPELSGPFLLAVVFFALALAIINLFLRPDPQQIAFQLDAIGSDSSSVRKVGRSFQQILAGDHRSKLAIGAMVFGQLTMVVVMTITPVHMHSHNHEIAAISWVIMAHTMGMFGLSFVVGWLVDRLGRTRMIMVGTIILINACIMAPLSTEVGWLALALFLLGLGWNCCFVAGSTLLSDILHPHEKGRIQGLADTIVSVSSGVGSFGGGLLFAAIGFAVTSQLGIIAALIPLLLVFFLRAGQAERPLEGTLPG